MIRGLAFRNCEKCNAPLNPLTGQCDKTELTQLRAQLEEREAENQRIKEEAFNLVEQNIGLRQAIEKAINNYRGKTTKDGEPIVLIPVWDFENLQSALSSTPPATDKLKDKMIELMAKDYLPFRSDEELNGYIKGIESQAQRSLDGGE
jgi:predicted RNase H-like nuclease (RuvC/YqgF family)